VLQNLYIYIIQVIKSRRIRWAWHVPGRGGNEKCIQYFVWKPGRKRPRGIPRRRWEDNIIMDLREKVREVVDCIHLAQDRDQFWALVNTVMNLRVP